MFFKKFVLEEGDYVQEFEYDSEKNEVQVTTRFLGALVEAKSFRADRVRVSKDEHGDITVDMKITDEEWEKQCQSH